ncbi:MAG: hypothetical protein EA353_12665 [Puniceicoccaceae bacterium]|nr:MAG: hypothetical protein EA353_12665 [Puniceicoccaceae bacterium]
MNETNESYDAGEDPFVEQAEYINPEHLLKWSSQHPDEQDILNKLCRSGAKLLTGPRGCGKTTLLLKAYRRMLEDDQSSSLPVYVNYKVSLKLEPLYKEKANASFWFKQWLLAKIYLGIYRSLENRSDLESPSALSAHKQNLVQLVSKLEVGGTPKIDEAIVSVENLNSDVQLILSNTNAKRCVLLLDDAAHAFSPEQQQDFFDIFRQLKSRYVAPKAAIYPGVTVLTPGFQLGHDADEINAWIDPYGEGYLNFMLELIQKRVSENTFRELSKHESYLKLICYSAFGMPRAALNMVRIFSESSGNMGAPKKVGQRSVIESIRTSYHNTVSVYESLKYKIPAYAKFIREGKKIEERCLSAVKEYNRGKDRNLQSVTIAIKDEAASEIHRVFGFYQYAGLMRFHNKISRGVKGTFLLYRLHIGALIDGNCLYARKAINADDYIHALQHRNAHSFTRLGENSLVGKEGAKSVLKLALPACSNCGAQRTSEAAMFCSSCGQQLQDPSVFNSLVSQSISALPLTDHRKKRIRENSNIRQIKDIMMDIDSKELLKVPQIGPIWSQRIKTYADEFIS